MAQISEIQDLINNYEEALELIEHDIREYRRLMRFETDDDVLLNYADCLNFSINDKKRVESTLAKLRNRLKGNK